MLTLERLREVLRYDPETGEWTRPDGSRAGCEDHGYVRITIDGHRYYAHRLAVFWMTRRWPRSLVDHEDKNGLNNRWRNLREATKSTNGANRGVSRVSKSGVKGVSLCRVTGRWRADITVQGMRYNLGRFASKEEAAAAYERAACESFGAFARAV